MLNLYKLLMNSPAIASGWLHMGTAVRMESSLRGDMRELAVTPIERRAPQPHPGRH